MPAVIIDGKKLGEQLKDQVRLETEFLKTKGIFPSLAVLLVGENPASKVYVNRKTVSCEEVGIKSLQLFFPQTVSEDELLQTIARLNNDPAVHGLLVQLPLPPHINEHVIMFAVLPEKDVDGFHFLNQGKTLAASADLIANTPRGIIRLIESTGISIAGKHAVVVGRSLTVGKPTAILLLQHDATVTVCHSKTKNLAEKTQQADILVVAAGKPHLVTADMVKPGAIVIDVGISTSENGLTGDVDFENVKNVAGFITPVPGGVGPMTVACLLENTVIACKKQFPSESFSALPETGSTICLGILGSTRGTDLQAIIDAIESKQMAARIGLVASDQADAFILQRARSHTIQTLALDKKQFSSSAEFDRSLAEHMKKQGVELVLLIGYKKILTKTFLDAFPNRVLNIHPSLLPAFGGAFDADVHQAVLDSGVKITGATLHLATEKVDAGTIILQKAVLVAPEETVDSLKNKVQRLEQALFLEAIPLFAEKKIQIENNKRVMPI